MKKVKIYTGILGQYGDIVMFTAVIKRIKELIPNSEITFAISKKYGDIKDLIERDPLVNKVFITDNYFEKLEEGNYFKRKIRKKFFSKRGYIDLRGEEEVAEQNKKDIVFETRPNHKDLDWFNRTHQIEQCGKNIGIEKVSLKTRLFPLEKIPAKFKLKPKEYIVVHTESGAKHKSWNKIEELKQELKNEKLFIVQDEKTSILELATIIKNAKLFIGIDSMPIWIAGSFDIPIIGLYGSLQYGIPTKYIYPENNKSEYLQVIGHPDNINVEQIIEAIKRLGVK
jgi:ADP-heptose:LPS heptosyltransferase